MSIIEGDPEDVGSTKWFAIKDEDGDVIIVSVSKLLRVLHELVKEEGVDVDSIYKRTRKEANEIARKMYFE
ncbi:hypothetical protein [Methanopyrus sp.]